MSTTTKPAAPKSTDDAPKPTTLAERAKAQKAATKSATTRKPSAKRAPKSTPTADAPKPAKRAPRKPKTDDAPKTTPKPKTDAPVDVDRVAAARATELLRHGGAYANASGVSAKQLRDFGAALDVPALTALSGPGKPVSKAFALKLATGESKPTSEQKAAWAHATKRYAKAAFGVDGPTTKNKVTGRKIACVLAAIAERDGQL